VSVGWLQTLTNVRQLAVSMDTIAMATLNASTLLDHTAVDVQLATSVLIPTPAPVSHLSRSLVVLISYALGFQSLFNRPIQI